MNGESCGYSSNVDIWVKQKKKEKISKDGKTKNLEE